MLGVCLRAPDRGFLENAMGWCRVLPGPWFWAGAAGFLTGAAAEVGPLSSGVMLGGCLLMALALERWAQRD